MPNALPQAMERLEFPDLLNARDLGGHPTAGGGRTRWKAFLRTDGLFRLTPEGERALRRYGVRTVVDLRWREELQVSPTVFQKRPGDASYHHVSLLRETEEEWRLGTPVVPKEAWNRLILDHAPTEIARTLNVMASAGPGTVLFHCAAGKDRTGLIASVLLAIAGVPVDSIAEDYARSTDYLRDPYLAGKPLEEHPQALEDIRCPVEQVTTMMVHLEERYGGLDGYLEKIGVGRPVVSRLRERLVE